MMQPESPYQPPATFEPSFIQSVSSNRGLTMKQVLFSFEGRIPRRTYWLGSLLSILAMIPVGLLSPLLNHPGWEFVFWIILIPLVILFIWASLAIQVKRWHDVDKSGMWILIGLIPYIGGLIAFVFNGCIRGTEGPNRYGDDPT